MIELLKSALRDVDAARQSGLDGADLVAVIDAAQSIVRTTQALLLDATAAAHRADTARSQGSASTQAWIAQTSGRTHRDAAREIKLATDLETVAPQTREAMSQPGMSTDKARVITGAMTSLPRQLDAQQRAAVEADLVARARRHSVDDLRRAAKRAVEVLDAQWADQLEATTLAAEERRAQRHTDFWVRPADADGMVEGGFTLPQFEADILASAMESLTAPATAPTTTLSSSTIGPPPASGSGALLHISSAVSPPTPTATTAGSRQRSSSPSTSTPSGARSNGRRPAVKDPDSRPTPSVRPRATPTCCQRCSVPKVTCSILAVLNGSSPRPSASR